MQFPRLEETVRRLDWENTWLSTPPGQWPACEAPPELLQEAVAIHIPFWPLLIVQPVVPGAARPWEEMQRRRATTELERI